MHLPQAGTAAQSLHSPSDSQRSCPRVQEGHRRYRDMAGGWTIPSREPTLRLETVPKRKGRRAGMSRKVLRQLDRVRALCMIRVRFAGSLTRMWAWSSFMSRRVAEAEVIRAAMWDRVTAATVGVGQPGNKGRSLSMLWIGCCGEVPVLLDQCLPACMP